MSSCGGTGAGCAGAAKRLVLAAPGSTCKEPGFNAGRLMLDGDVGVSMVAVGGVRPRSTVAGELVPPQPGCVVVVVRPVVVAGLPGGYGDAPSVLSGVVVVVVLSGRTVSGCVAEPAGICCMVVPGAFPVVRPATPVELPGVVALAAFDPGRRLPV